MLTLPTPSLTPMDPESNRSGGYSPGRRRVIALAGAGGLAGVAATIWPWKQPAGEPAITPGPASPPAVKVPVAEEVPAAPSSPVVASDSPVSVERERFARHVGEVFRAQDRLAARQKVADPID